MGENDTLWQPLGTGGVEDDRHVVRLACDERAAFHQHTRQFVHERHGGADIFRVDDLDDLRHVGDKGFELGLLHEGAGGQDDLCL
ncbi:hypothetical protein D3C71_1650400 [compost metagenome]